MGVKDLRDWISKLEADGELKRIKAKVDWNLELAAVTRRALGQRGRPALLFENIKDHENTRSTTRSAVPEYFLPRCATRPPVLPS